MSELRRQSEALRPELAAAILEVLDSGWFILGEGVRRFEAAFAAYLNVAHAVGVANGTDALELGLRALGVGPGDRVVTAANAGGYSTIAIHACGAQAQFVDVDRDHGGFDPSGLAAALDSRPRAIVITHLYGRLGPVEEVAAAARAAGVAVLEDCAQAHGARRGGVFAGAFGDAGCYSFYPTKNLGALGDGGAVVSNDAAIAERVRQLRQYGWEGKYRVTLEHGRNSRLDEMQAAVLQVKLAWLDRENARRRDIAAAYAKGIRNGAIVVPRRGGEDDVVHLFVVRCAQREALRTHLAAAGIRSDVHYPIPDHRQPAFAARYGTVSLPATEALAAEVLTLPAHPALGEGEIALVIEACNGFRAR
ncbi:MAG TPA: DegT/DnrJ/EryC1/StrS family aminotransferase [Usitatibacter sp.]|nr:DegT/DnrJ/EryC1/StrS family aminotransferase [Usitatibacter sp.]